MLIIYSQSTVTLLWAIAITAPILFGFATVFVVLMPGVRWNIKIENVLNKPHWILLQFYCLENVYFVGSVFFLSLSIICQSHNFHDWRIRLRWSFLWRRQGSGKRLCWLRHVGLGYFCCFHCPSPRELSNWPCCRRDTRKFDALDK